MSGKQARKVRKEYHRAAAMYWTKDMEREIRKLYRSRKIWRAVCLGEALAAIVGGIIYLV